MSTSIVVNLDEDEEITLHLEDDTNTYSPELVVNLDENEEITTYFKERPTELITSSDADTYNLGNTVNLITEVTHTNGRDAIDSSSLNLTLTDPNGTERISSEQPLEFSDYFTSSTDTNNDWTLATDYSVDETNEYLTYGYSGSYFQTALIDSTVLSDRKELSVATKFNVRTNAEHMTRIVARYQDSDNYVAFYASKEYSVVGIEEIHGGDRVFKEVSKPFTTDQWMEMRGSIDGNVATLIFQGENLVEKELEYITSTGQTGLMTDASEVDYDYFTVGIPDSTVTNITDGYKVEVPYDIPVDSTLGGIWDQYAEFTADGTVYSDTNTFSVVSSEPNFANDDVTRDSLWAGDNRYLEIDVLHETPSDIDNTHLKIWNPEGTLMVDTDVTETNQLSDRYTYDYTYTPPTNLASDGTWEYEWTTSDVNSNTDTYTDTFPVYTDNPDITKPNVIKNSTDLDVAFFNDTVSIEADITHPTDKSFTPTISIDDPSGTTVVNSASLTAGSGDTYYYDYTFSGDNWDRGTYTITFSADDGTYVSTKERKIPLYWSDSEFSFKVPIDINDEFGYDRTEVAGVTLVFDDADIAGNRLRLYNDSGAQVDYELVETRTVNGNVEKDIRFDASTQTKYYAYFDDTGTEYTSTSVSVKKIAINEKQFTWINTSDFYSTVDTSDAGTHGSSVAVGEFNGSWKRVVVGKSKNNTTSDGFHEWQSCVTIIDETDSVEHQELLSYNAQSGWYSAKLADVNGDGDNELVLAGYTFPSTSNPASALLAVYDYDGSTLTELASTTWTNGDSTIRCEFFASDVVDISGNANPDIIVGGMNGEGSNATNSQLRVYNVDGSNNISFIDYADTGLVDAITDNERDRIFSIEEGDFGSGTKIVSTGTTQSGETNDEGHWVLYGTICVYNFDTSTSSFSREFQHYYYENQDLTEIFGLEVDDVTGDGVDNILTSGNWYDYNNGSDRADIRLWDYDESTPSITQLSQVDWLSEGHSTVLSIKHCDINGDFRNEICGAGFFHDGEYDKGFNMILYYDGTDLQKLQWKTWEADGRTIRDGETDALEIYENSDGIPEIITTGRIGMTEPIDSYFRLLEISGINPTQGTIEKETIPLTDVRYRIDSAGSKTLDKVSIDVSSSTQYTYYTFTGYDLSTSPITLEWDEEVNETGVTVGYTVNSPEINWPYELTRNGSTYATPTSDDTGTVTFDTTNHSTNSYTLSEDGNTEVYNYQTERVGYKEEWVVGDTKTYNFTGSKEEVLLLSGSYKIEVLGGGGSAATSMYLERAGNGGKITGEIEIDEPKFAEIWVGERGGESVYSSTEPADDVYTAGWGRHDGGEGGYYDGFTAAGGGAGSTEVKIDDMLLAADGAGGNSEYTDGEYISGGGGAACGIGGDSDSTNAEYAGDDAECPTTRTGYGSDGADSVSDNKYQTSNDAGQEYISPSEFTLSNVTETTGGGGQGGHYDLGEAAENGTVKITSLEGEQIISFQSERYLNEKTTSNYQTERYIYETNINNYQSERELIKENILTNYQTERVPKSQYINDYQTTRENIEEETDVGQVERENIEKEIPTYQTERYINEKVNPNFQSERLNEIIDIINFQTERDLIAGTKYIINYQAERNLYGKVTPDYQTTRENIEEETDVGQVERENIEKEIPTYQSERENIEKLVPTYQSERENIEKEKYERQLQRELVLEKELIGQVERETLLQVINNYQKERYLKEKFSQTFQTTRRARYEFRRIEFLIDVIMESIKTEYDVENIIIDYDIEDIDIDYWIGDEDV